MRLCIIVCQIDRLSKASVLGSCNHRYFLEACWVVWLICRGRCNGIGGQTKIWYEPQGSFLCVEDKSVGLVLKTSKVTKRFLEDSFAKCKMHPKKNHRRLLMFNILRFVTTVTVSNNTNYSKLTVRRSLKNSLWSAMIWNVCTKQYYRLGASGIEGLEQHDSNRTVS